MNSLGGRVGPSVTGYFLTIRTQSDFRQLIEMLWFEAKNQTRISNRQVMNKIYRGAASSNWVNPSENGKYVSYVEAITHCAMMWKLNQIKTLTESEWETKWDIFQEKYSLWWKMDCWEKQIVNVCWWMIELRLAYCFFLVVLSVLVILQVNSCRLQDCVCVFVFVCEICDNESAFLFCVKKPACKNQQVLQLNEPAVRHGGAVLVILVCVGSRPDWKWIF